MAFDYDADTEADVSSVADSIRVSHCLPPPTEEQKAYRRAEIEAWREEQRWQSERRRAERERQQQEREGIARQEAAVALAEANRKRRLEQQERGQETRREQ